MPGSRSKHEKQALQAMQANLLYLLIAGTEHPWQQRGLFLIALLQRVRLVAVAPSARAGSPFLLELSSTWRLTRSAQLPALADRFAHLATAHEYHRVPKFWTH